MRSVMLLTSDGKTVRWPFCAPTESTTSLSYEQIKALRDPIAIRRIMAHEHLLRAQVVKLYGGKPSSLRRGLWLCRLAKRIRELGLMDLCAGLGEQIIMSTVAMNKAPAQIRSELLQFDPRRKTVVMYDDIDDVDEDEEKKA